MSQKLVNQKLKSTRVAKVLRSTKKVQLHVPAEPSLQIKYDRLKEQNGQMAKEIAKLRDNLSTCIESQRASRNSSDLCNEVPYHLYKATITACKSIEHDVTSIQSTLRSLTSLMQRKYSSPSVELTADSNDLASPDLAANPSSSRITMSPKEQESRRRSSFEKIKSYFHFFSELSTILEMTSEFGRSSYCPINRHSSMEQRQSVPQIVSRPFSSIDEDESDDGPEKTPTVETSKSFEIQKQIFNRSKLTKRSPQVESMSQANIQHSLTSRTISEINEISPNQESSATKDEFITAMEEKANSSPGKLLIRDSLATSYRMSKFSNEGIILADETSLNHRMKGLSGNSAEFCVIDETKYFCEEEVVRSEEKKSDTACCPLVEDIVLSKSNEKKVQKNEKLTTVCKAIPYNFDDDVSDDLNFILESKVKQKQNRILQRRSSTDSEIEQPKRVARKRIKREPPKAKNIPEPNSSLESQGGSGRSLRPRAKKMFSPECSEPKPRRVIKSKPKDKKVKS